MQHLYQLKQTLASDSLCTNYIYILLWGSMNFYCVIPGRVLAPDFGLYRAYIYIPGVTASEDDIIFEAVARVSYQL